MNHELPDAQPSFRKARGTRDQIANICWIIEKERVPRKHLLLLIDYTKAFDCMDYNKLWKILKDIRIPGHLTCFLRNLYAGQEVRELDMEKQTGSRLGKDYIKAVYCHPAYLIYMQSTSCEMPD